MEVIKKEIQDLYNKVVFEYEKHLIGFNYEIFKMNDFERVYLVEDVFAIYLGIMNFSPSKKIYGILLFLKNYWKIQFSSLTILHFVKSFQRVAQIYDGCIIRDFMEYGMSQYGVKMNLVCKWKSIVQAKI